jgi:hypothetical protein
VYLAVVLDLFSRKMVDWSLSDSIDTAFRCVRLRGQVPGHLVMADRAVQHR